jgi:hypothetical protein
MNAGADACKTRPIVLLARERAVSNNGGDETPFRERTMPACRKVTAKDQISLARIARLLLVFLLQSLVVLLAGFAALLVDFEPGWSAEDPPASLLRPSDRFNVIRFDDTMDVRFPASVPGG